MKQMHQFTIYQFKITLRDITPPIWRRIQVPAEYMFWDLHVAIQDAMGWEDSHLHDFAFRKDRFDRGVHIGIPDPDNDDVQRNIIPGWKAKIKDYFVAEKSKAIYWYDFGDDWTHDVVLEKILPYDPKQKYPACMAGKRACPPENCGSIPGYYTICEAMANPKDKNRKELLEWLGGVYDPEKFNARDVAFTDPKPRLKMLLKDMRLE